jgi:hypothetical protein
MCLQVSESTAWGWAYVLWAIVMVFTRLHQHRTDNLLTCVCR